VRLYLGIDLGSTTTKACWSTTTSQRPRARHHQLALELRHDVAASPSGARDPTPAGAGAAPLGRDGRAPWPRRSRPARERPSEPPTSSAPATAAPGCRSRGAHPLRDPLPRPGRARDVPGTRTVLDIGGQDTKAIQVDGGHRRELPDERPLRRRLRPLPRLHRRRDEHGPARAGADGDEVDQGDPHQLDLHGVRRRRAARPPGARATSARTSSPGCTAPSSCARCRSWRARAASRDEFTFTGGVAKNEAAVKCAARAGQGELRRADDQHRPDSIYTGALGAAPSPARVGRRPRPPSEA
jgi:hypothetical protein